MPKYVKNTEVTFNCTCKTEFGDKVALIGNIPLLGHWEVCKSIIMSTN